MAIVATVTETVSVANAATTTVMTLHTIEHASVRAGLQHTAVTSFLCPFSKMGGFSG